MTRLNVNPTRIELKRLKTRLKTAVRGHKMLKDKSDEMIRQFTTLIKKNANLRNRLEKEVVLNLKQFALARSLMPLPAIETAFAIPFEAMELSCSSKNIMNVPVPKIEIVQKKVKSLPFSFVDTSLQLDACVEQQLALVPKLIALGELEKSCSILSREIEKTKRRVNALEYVMIPKLEETIKYISMKIEENERASRVRLIKVKDIINAR